MGINVHLIRQKAHHLFHTIALCDKKNTNVQKMYCKSCNALESLAFFIVCVCSFFNFETVTLDQFTVLRKEKKTVWNDW